MTKIVKDLAELGAAVNLPPKPRPPFWDVKALPIRLDRLLAFISHYLRENNTTPTRRAMANEMEESEAAVQFWLNRLDNMRRIHVVSRNPLRIMVTATHRIPALADARRLDNALKGSRMSAEDSPQARFEAADAQRIRILHTIGEHWQEKGEGPTLMEIAKAVDMSGPGYVIGALDVLQKRKLITFDPDRARSAQLTEEGRMATGFSTPTTQQGNTPPALAAARAGVALKYEEKLRRLHAGLAKLAEGGREVTSVDIRRLGNYTHRNAALKAGKDLEARGLVRKKPTSTLRAPTAFEVIKEGKPVAATGKPVAAVEKSASKPSRRGSRRMNPLRRAEQFARIIDENWKSWDEGPSYFIFQEKTGMTNVTGVLNWMEARGLIERKPYTHNTIKLTAKGREKLLGDTQEATEPQAEQPVDKSVGTSEPVEAAPVITESTTEDYVDSIVDAVDPLVTGIVALRRRVKELEAQVEAQRQPAEMSEGDMIIALMQRGFSVSRS